MAVHQWTRQDKIKRGVWAFAFAACVFVGTITGAQLKTDKQKEEAITQFRATSPAEQIAILEQQKESLQKQKAVIQRKLDLFNERVAARDVERAERAAKNNEKP